MMNMSQKQRCNATHMDDAGYKHSCKLLIGHPGDHKCSKFSYSWEDCKRPMNPKHPLDAGLAERLWLVGVKAAEAGGAHYMVKPDWEKLSKEYRVGWESVADECRRIVFEMTTLKQRTIKRIRENEVRKIMKEETKKGERK